MSYYSCNMTDYGQTTPHPHWPNDAYIAVQFVLNYDGDDENTVLQEDTTSNGLLPKINGTSPWSNQRHSNMQSIYEYGAHAGFWRTYRLFTEKKIPVTIFGTATALMHSPEQVAAMKNAGWEIASHGYKRIDHKDVSAEDERKQMAEAIRLHTIATGQRPSGWCIGRCSGNTIDLASEEGGFEYLSNTHDGDIPYWRVHNGKPQLLIPYTLDMNDIRFMTQQGFASADQFYAYLKDSFDTLYEEGKNGSPKMMTIGLHCRVIGRPGRIGSVSRFIDHVRSHEKVWIPTRVEIARHWTTTHPYRKPKLIPSQMDRETFLAQFSSILESSSWIIEKTFDGKLGRPNDTVNGLFFAIRSQFRSVTDAELVGILCGFPDLAGKLAAAKRLTTLSNQEHISAGIDALTDDERQEFNEYNEAYKVKFRFPFIIAARDNTKASILAAFKTRINNDRNTELMAASAQVERIAYLRLKDIFLE